MAHYIAEKMDAIDYSNGEAKASAQRECFETILMLWDRQSCFSHNLRPFKNFDSVFRALAHIDPSNATPSYFRNENGINQPPKEIEQAIKFITSLDTSARILISFFVREAILHATDESTLEWLDAIKGIDKSDEAKAILEFMIYLDKNDTVQNKNEDRKNELTKHIDRLKTFESLSKKIKSIFEAELEKLETR